MFYHKFHDKQKVLSRCGGIGRRDGFKIHCPQGRAGSIPVIGTIEVFNEKPHFLVSFFRYIKHSFDYLVNAK